MNQPILLYRSGSVYANETAAWAALDAVTHKKGQPIVAFYTLSSPVSGHHGSSTIGAIFAIGIGDGVGQYKACTSHDDMLIVAQSLNAHITQFNQMFEYDANHNAIKAKLDFYTTDGKSISAGGIGSGSSASLGALYQLVDVMANSSNTGVEGAVEGSVLAYDATAGKWKAIAQSEILPDMSGYYTKDETDSAINTAKSNLQGQVDTLKALIPATATADNQLADKDFVNSSIATATAEFRGSFTSLDELKATSGNLNDYAFYLHTDSVGNSIVDRYKWTTAGWLYEYTLNNSSFTAEQWAALNSAITATLVQSYNSHLNNSAIHITAAERTAWNAKWDYNEETIKAVKVNAAVNADKLATARTLWGQSFDGSGNVSGDLIDVGNITASGKATIQGDIVCGGEVAAIVGEGTPAGVTDYSALTGKPSINGVTLLSGNNTLAALGIQAAGDYATNSGVTTLLADYATKTFVANNYAGKSAFNSHTADTDIHITAAERNAWNAKWNYDEATIKAVKVTSASSADSVAWSGISGKPTTFTPSAHTHTASEVSGLPTSLKNPYALTFGTKTYDGSAAATITASDLGALTAHQSIYALTLQVNSVSQGTYNPASASKTINIAVPTKTSDITNDSGFITSAAIPTALKNPYAVEIKANGVSLGTYDGSAVATFNLSAANVGAANKVHSHTASEVSGLPTNLSAFTNDVGYITGITKSMVEGVLTGDITSHTHSYLPLTGGTITGTLRLGNPDVLYNGANTTLFRNASSTADYGTQIVNNWNEGSTRILLNSNGVYYWDANGNMYPIIHSGNYNSYAPTLTGTGASGTWGINISGNAATATNATSAGNVLFDNTVTRLSSGQNLDNYTKGLYGYSNADNPTNSYGNNTAVFAFQSERGVDTWQIAFEGNGIQSTDGPAFAIRGNFANQGWTGWYPIAKISSNVASATKLQTPRTIWGQSFDGTKDIWGGLEIHLPDNWNYVTFIQPTSNGLTINTLESGVAFKNIILNPDGGNVGIGTVTPQYKLDVNGRGHYSGDLIVDGEVSALVA